MKSAQNKELRENMVGGHALSSLICSLAPHWHSFVMEQIQDGCIQIHSVKCNCIYNKTEAVGQQVCVKQSRKNLCIDGEKHQIIQKSTLKK